MNIHVYTNIFVKHLELSENRIYELDEAPQFFENITDLDISKNHLDRMSSKFTKKLVNLEKLSFANSVQLKGKLFENLKKLKELNLELCGIRSVDVEAFTGTTSLEVINFNDNYLTDLDYKNLVKVVPSLRSIDIDYNDFSCDFIREMDEYLKNNTKLRITLVGEKEIVAGPYTKYYHGILCDAIHPFESWYGAVVIGLVAIITAILLLKDDIKRWFAERSYRTMPANMSSANFQTTTEDDVNT